MHLEHTFGNMPKASAVRPRKTQMHTCRGENKAATITNYMFLYFTNDMLFKRMHPYMTPH